ncbi:MAG: Lrp/AsnC family transcriptional regulator [Candidatus Bathyarchaeota archaeon]|nr:Lrp/AsnC family transcriptional regulator [Candidatus Bathyarchaeota archaeon]
MKFDDTDIRILRNLQKDARVNFADIAKECGVSIDTIIKRFQRLRRDGVVRGTTILLDPRRFGLDCPASLEIGVDPLHVEEVVETLRKQPGVAFCTPSVGMQNVFAVVLSRNMNELNTLIEQTKSLHDVREVKTSLWVEDILLCPENFELEGLKRRVD